MSTRQSLQPICILGPHRSGSSVVSRLLNLLGVYLGPEPHIMPPSAYNPKGYWEHRILTAINDEVLARLGGSWHEPPVFPPGWETLPNLADLRQRARSVLREDFARKELWGWKDPRTCLTLAFWQKLLPRLRYVICLRNPLDVARSLERRDAFPLEKGVRLWLIHTTSAFRHTSGCPRFLVFYEDIMRDWPSEAKRLASFLGRPEPRKQSEVFRATRKFLEEELHHHRTQAIDVIDEPQVTFPAKALYLVLRTYGGGSLLEGRDLHLEKVIDLFSSYALEAQASRENLTQLMAALREQLSQRAQDVEQLQDARATLEGEVGRLQTQLTEREQILASTARGRAELEEALGERQAQVERLAAAVASRDGCISELEGEWGRLEAALDKGESREAELRAQMAAVETALREGETREAELRVQLARAEVAVGQRERQVEELKVAMERVGELERQIAAQLQTNTTLEKKAGQLEGHLTRVLSSKSWKLTLPLRRFYFTLGRLYAMSRSFLQSWKQGLIGIREFWHHKVHDQLVLCSLAPTMVDVGPQDPKAAIDWIPEVDIGDQGRSAFFTHPPARITYALRVRPNTFFRAFVALRPEVWGRNPNGVEFSLFVSSRSGGRQTVRRLPIHPTRFPSHRRWHEFRVSLGRFANREVEFTLSTSVPRGDPADYAWAVWGDPALWSRKPMRKIWLLLKDYLRKYGFMGMLTRIGNVARKRAELGHLGIERNPVSRLPDSNDGEQIPLPSMKVEGPTDRRYAAWLTFNAFSGGVATALRAALETRGDRLPRISIVMPVYNTSVRLLDRAIQSVLSQVYENWELCIADDASSDPRTTEAIQRWGERDPRIKILFRTENGGISRATNTAADLTTGDFLAFLDHDDELTPDALAEVAIYCSDHPDAELVYSDDDKIDLEGRPFAPQFKPDWSPILLLSYMYLGHLLVVRHVLFDQLGGFRVGFEGSQDYDFALRASERVKRVGHIPKVLYHWRAVPGSTAVSGDAKPASFDAGRRAVAEALERRGIVATVGAPKWAVDARVGIFAASFAHTGPRVAIIIPTRNRLDLLSSCIESLRSTRYENYEVVIVDNESDDPKVLSYLHSLPHKVLRIANPPGERFSFAYVVNQAAHQVDADYLLFLNNDVVVRTPDWLSQMMGYARMDKVGAVGARLLFPNDTIQHAGVVHGFNGGMCGHAFRNLPSRENGYLSYDMVAREYSAVTAACLLTPRTLFLEQGGFDEVSFAVAYNDVDYCYRLVDRGYRCVYCPSAELIHLEGKSRGFNDNLQEIAAFRLRYSGRVDPWYNPNLSLDDEHFQVRPYHAPLPVDRPVHAALISHNLNLEGAPKHQLEITVGLARRSIIDPVVLSPTDGPLRIQYEEAGIPVRIIPSPLIDMHTAAGFSKRLDDLASLYHALGTEVVFGNTLQTFWAIAAGDRAGLPTLWNVHESEPWQTYFDFLAPELRRCAYGCLGYPYRVIFVAYANREVWRPLETQFNFTVIHHGLNLTRLEHRLSGLDRAATRQSLGISPDDIAVVLVGTVCERKGQMDLVRALPEMPPTVVRRLRAFIVGDRPNAYSAALHRELEKLQLTLRRQLTMVPETDEVPTYYKAADIALCTSRIEAYPAVILEAMACGLPLVTTPVFGIREQVCEGINALFYEPGNAVALAAMLTRLVEDDVLSRQFASNSRLVLETLTSYSEMLERFGEIFREARFSKAHRLGETAKFADTEMLVDNRNRFLGRPKREVSSPT